MKKEIVLCILVILMTTGCGPSFFGGFSGIVAPDKSNEIFYGEISREEEMRREFESAIHFFRNFGWDGSRCDFKGCENILKEKREFYLKNYKEAKEKGIL